MINHKRNVIHLLQIARNGIRFSLFTTITLLIPSLLSGQFEICDNGLDDDNDGLIDLNDDDCMCDVVEAVSLIPNPSFEEMNCCPDDRSQLNCATDWIQASEPTTDFIHTCDWLGWDQFPPPQPFPDGEGIMGFRDGRVRNNNDPEPYWKEYAGACLLSPLLKDTLYRFQFDVGFVDPQKSPPIDISFFGTNSCDYLPFGIGNDAFGCPSNSANWFKLAEVIVSGGEGNMWVNTFLEITPDQDINAIAIGPDCAPIATPNSIYYFFDNLLLATVGAFDLRITEVQHPCSPDFVLSVPYNPEFEYQWYKEGVALNGEIFSELIQNYGEGSYQVRILDEDECRISAEFLYDVPVFSAPVTTSICDGDFYEFGDLQLVEPGFYLDTFLTENGCDSIVQLNLNIIGQSYDTLEVSVFEGESYQIQDYSFQEEGDYPIVLVSELGCDSLVLLKLTNFKVYIPNAFTPNNDGINDWFLPFAPDFEITSIDMQIYDRWGNKVFQGESWDGNNAQAGVYVYAISLNFLNGTSRSFYGDVTLFR